MKRIVMTAKVDSDGMLNVRIPNGWAEADQEVRVTVESNADTERLTPAHWAAWVDSMAGSWQGDFERPPQGELER